MIWILHVFIIWCAVFVGISAIWILVNKIINRNKDVKINSFRANSYIAVMAALVISGVIRYQSKDTSQLNLDDRGYYLLIADSYDKTNLGKYAVTFTENISGNNYYYRLNLSSYEEAEEAVKSGWRIARRIFIDQDGDIFYGSKDDTDIEFFVENNKWVFVYFGTFIIMMFCLLKIILEKIQKKSKFF